MAIYCSASNVSELETHLNEDLSYIRNWLNLYKLSLNLNKSKFMMIGGTQRLKKFESIKLLIDEIELERVKRYKYLGVILNENLSWTDHVEYIQAKISQRLGMLRRIKHLLPQETRKLMVNTLVMPLMDYADVVWGDRNNVSLMQQIQVLHNKAAKLVLDLPWFSSSTLALQSVKWKLLKDRRFFHRCAFVFKSLNGTVDFNFGNSFIYDIHSYNIRNKSNMILPKSKTNWGQQRSEYLFIKHWNSLPKELIATNSFNTFRSIFWKFC